MIINTERSPSMSLYYIGGLVLKALKKENNQAIENLYLLIKNDIGFDLHIDFLYYTLDWLFIISCVKLENGRICLCELID